MNKPTLLLCVVGSFLSFLFDIHASTLMYRPKSPYPEKLQFLFNILFFFWSPSDDAVREMHRNCSKNDFRKVILSVPGMCSTHTLSQASFILSSQRESTNIYNMNI
jgi:hypothetical protein